MEGSVVFARVWDGSLGLVCAFINGGENFALGTITVCLYQNGP